MLVGGVALLLLVLILKLFHYVRIVFNGFDLRSGLIERLLVVVFVTFWLEWEVIVVFTPSKGLDSEVGAPLLELGGEVATWLHLCSLEA